MRHMCISPDQYGQRPRHSFVEYYFVGERNHNTPYNRLLWIESKFRNIPFQQKPCGTVSKRFRRSSNDRCILRLSRVLYNAHNLFGLSSALVQNKGTFTVSFVL